MSAINLPSLYPEKVDRLAMIKDYLSTHKMGYIKVATGWGKTLLSKHLMKQYYEEGKAVLFLVSRNNALLDQTFYSDLNSKKPLFSNSIAISSNHRKISSDKLENAICRRDSGIVIFASLETILSKSNSDVKTMLQNQLDLVVIDEIHNFIFNRGNQFIEGLAESTKVFGMTATPFQGVVGNVKFVDKISGDMREIFSKTLPRCIVEGQLSELNYSILYSHQSVLDVFDLSGGINELAKPELYLDCRTTEKISRTIQRTHLAKRACSDMGFDNSKTLVFCAPVRNIGQGYEGEEKAVTAFHAKLSAAIFNGEIHDRIGQNFEFSNYDSNGCLKNAVYISSDIPKKEQHKIVNQFKTMGSGPSMLCSVGTLIEGFDFPELSNLVLLRPTLSMRLYEQQIGRVTRKSDNKERGNIIEIADDIDSIYDAFGDQVFNEKNSDRIQTLRPENRIEDVLGEDGDLEAISTGRINISSIDLSDNTAKVLQRSVQIPPISMRAKYFHKLLSAADEKTMGEMAKERKGILKATLGFKIRNKQDAREIADILNTLKQLKEKAQGDGTLSTNCSKLKPALFNEVSLLLKLVVLTSMRNLPSHDRDSSLLMILGFDGDWSKLDRYREQCFLELGEGDILVLYNKIKNFKRADRFLHELPSEQYPGAKNVGKKLFHQGLPQLYWAYQFTVDRPEFRELFESKDWTYNVKHFVVK